MQFDGSSRRARAAAALTMGALVAVLGGCAQGGSAAKTTAANQPGQPSAAGPAGQTDVPQTAAQKQAATTNVEQAAQKLAQSPSGVKVSYKVTVQAEGQSYTVPATLAYDYPKLAGRATVKGPAKTWEGFAVDDGETITGCTLTPAVVCVPLGESQMASAEKYAGAQAVAMLSMTSSLAEASGTDDLAGTGTKQILGRPAVCGTFTYPYEGGSSTWAVCLDVATGAPLYVEATASSGESFVATATAFGTATEADFAVPSNASLPTGQNIDQTTVDNAKKAAGTAAGQAAGAGANGSTAGKVIGNLRGR